MGDFHLPVSWLKLELVNSAIKYSPVLAISIGSNQALLYVTTLTGLNYGQFLTTVWSLQKK